MATINFATRQITAKVVYFGAPSAGTSTTVRWLHQALPNQDLSRLHSFGTEEDGEQVLYFEYVAGEAQPLGGMELRVQLYALPGGIEGPIHRGEILKGADMIVFVADARETTANVDALVGLEDTLAKGARQLDAVPVILQINHVDDEDARPREALEADLNPYGFPTVETVARSGRGIDEAHSLVVKGLVEDIRMGLAGDSSNVLLEALHDPDVERDDEVVQRHIAAIAQRRLQVEAERPDLQHLPSGEVIAVPYQPETLRGARPISVLDHTIDEDEVCISLALETAGGQAIRLEVRLENRPLSTGTAHTAGSSPSVRDYLDEGHLGARDLPPWLYGAIGVAGGTFLSVLLGYVAGLFD